MKRILLPVRRTADVESEAVAEIRFDITYKAVY